MMLNLGVMRGGEQIMLPFHTVDTTGAPVAITNWPTGSPPPTVTLRAFGGTDMVAAGDALAFAIDDLVDLGAYCVNGYAPIKAGLYAVIITGAVIDGVTCNAIVGTFQVGRADGRVTNNISGFSVVTQSTFTLPAVDMGVNVVGGVPTGQGLRGLVRSGHIIKLLTGAAKNELATITGYDPTTGSGTFTPPLTGLPVAGDSYSIFEAPNPAPLSEADFADNALSARVLAADAAAEIAADVGALTIADGTLTEAKFGTGALSNRVLADGAITAAKVATDAITAAKIATDAIIEIQTGLATAAALATVQADTDNIQTRLPAALVGGKMDSTGTVTLGTDSITAAVLAADAVAEIQSGLATAAAVAAIQADTDNLQTRLPAALVGGRIDASVGAMATDTLTAAAVAADAVTELQNGLATAAGLAALQGDTDNIQTRLPAALVGGKMDAAATISGLDGATITALANGVWDLVDKIEPGLSPQAALRVLMAVFAGLSTGVEGGAPAFKSADIVGGVVQGTKTRVVGTQNANDERTAVTLDVTDI